MKGFVLVGCLFAVSAYGAVPDRVNCEARKDRDRLPLTIQEGKRGIAPDEKVERLQNYKNHKVGVFYYKKDDSLGLLIDGTTSTTYDASKVANKLLTFLTTPDGTEIMCHSLTK